MDKPSRTHAEAIVLGPHYVFYMSTSICTCTAEDLPVLFNHFANIYKNHENLQCRDYFDWQFLNTPFSADVKYSFLLACKKGRIKGWLGYMPVELSIIGNYEKACVPMLWHSLDKNVEGLMLLKTLFKLYNSTLLLGGAPVSMNIFSLLKLKVLDEMPRYIAVIDASKCSLIFGGGISNLLESSAACLQFVKTSVTFQEVNRFQDEDEYYLDSFETIKGYVRRTGKYLNWRYKDIPRHDYKIVLGDNGQFAVYRIEKIANHDACVTRIVEWNISGDEFKGALKVILERSLLQNSILIDFFCTSDQLGHEFRQNGFMHIDMVKGIIPRYFRPIYFGDDEIRCAIKTSKNSLSDALMFEEMYITSGDADNDRVKS